MTGSRAIRSLSAALAFLAVTLAGPGWIQGAARDCIVHEKGRVLTSLPLDGSLGICGVIGLRWPGAGGDEYLGSGGLVLGFTNTAGEHVAPGTFEAIMLETDGLFDGCRRGKRFPHPTSDDDGDGLIDEDPLDGVDNDRDGALDEDFAAIGDEMLVTVAIDRETGLVRRQSSYTWNSGHVRDFIGFTTSLLYPRGDAGMLRNLDPVLYTDFSIGDEDDRSRGANDLFFIIEEEREGVTLRLPAARDGDRFAALLLLDAIGPRGEELGARALLVQANESLWAQLERVDVDGEGRSGGDGPGSIPVLPRGQGNGIPRETKDAAGGYGPIDGDGAIACRLDPLPEFWPGDELTLHWAIVFGNSERKLIKNALLAIETYEGLQDGEGTLHRWIVPARRAARIALDALPVLGWSQGRRQPAATIALPPSLEEEEVEWLRGLNAVVKHQQVDGKILITVDGPVDVESIFVEGQLTDGTIFTATLRRDMLLGAQDEGQPDDALADDSVQLYPNPFLTSLNINLRIFDSALTEEITCSSTVRIYDVRGRLVRTILEQGSLHPGEYLHTWDGHDEYGKEAAPGVYYVKLQIGDRSLTKRVILLR
jgi:hypothetical protein